MLCVMCFITKPDPNTTSFTDRCISRVWLSLSGLQLDVLRMFYESWNKEDPSAELVCSDDTVRSDVWLTVI